MWDGREHLVVPVVALQEAVIHAVNAKNAEYVPSASLTASVGKWNGHPLVVGHPVRDGRQISAHSPEVLERHGFGFIRQATMNGSRLGMEAMVDPARLTALKHDQLLADLRAGKPIEVSVGAFVTTNDKRGSYGGKQYDGEWTEINPDHLAFLPGGHGACSIEMGCGAHRMASTYLVTAEGFEVLGDLPGHEFHGNQYTEGSGEEDGDGDIVPKAGEGNTVPRGGHAEGDRVLVRGNMGRGAVNGEGKKGEIVEARGSFHVVKLSNGGRASYHESDLHNLDYEPPPIRSRSKVNENKPENTMKNIRKLFRGNAEGFEEATMDEPTSWSARFAAFMSDFRSLVGKRNSATDLALIQEMHDRSMALGAACPEKKTVAQEMMGLASKDCPTCEGTGQVTKNSQQQDCETCDGTGYLKAAAAIMPELKAAECGCKGATMEKKARIDALLKNAHNPIKDLSDATSEEVLGVLETLAGFYKKKDEELDEEKKKAAKAEEDMKAAQAAQIPAEELAELRSLAAAKKASDAQQKQTFVTSLKAAQKAYSESDLNGMDLNTLEKLSQVAKVEVDYSGKAIPTLRAAETSDFTPPNAYPSLAKKQAV
jgi:hypothetical protein